MALTVGGTPVKSVYVGSTPVTAVYVGAEKIWTAKEVVQITLGTGTQARDQLRAALSDRGLNYQTVTEIPFDIELVGSGSAEEMFDSCSSLTYVPDMDTSSVTNMEWMFYNCAALTHVPDMDAGQVTSMRGMFYGCSSLTSVPVMDTSQVATMRSMFYECLSLTEAPAMDTSSVTEAAYMFFGCAALASVPDMDTSLVTNADYMFYDCAALTDGNVRLIGRHPNVSAVGMITGSGLTREPWYNADGTPDDGPTAEVYEVSLSGKSGSNTAHSLVTVTVPVGETWGVRVQGAMQSSVSGSAITPQIRIGSSTSSGYGNGASVDYSGTITSSNSTIALVTRHDSWMGSAGFTGTVTIEK